MLPPKKRSCELLKRAYVEPRYKVASAQFAYPDGRMKLQRLSKKTCEARIERYLSP